VLLLSEVYLEFYQKYSKSKFNYNIKTQLQYQKSIAITILKIKLKFEIDIVIDFDITSAITLKSYCLFRACSRYFRYYPVLEFLP